MPTPRAAQLSAAVFAVALAVLPAAALRAQTAAPPPGAPSPGPGCSCGAHPPGIPPQRTLAPYAQTPPDLQPYAHFAKPYYENYTQTNVYTGAGRLIPTPAHVTDVPIGFLGPIARQADQLYGLQMLHGAQLAIRQANARGGYGGKPFRLLLYDDYSNWQFAAQPGETRPKDEAIWGAPIDQAVRMIDQDHAWAIFGSISSESTHMVLRLALKAEIPIVNSASTDPTIPETYIPWYFTDVQDDRVQGYTLARRIFTQLHLARPALLRVNSRYGRMGVPKFRDAARRLGHPVVIEQKYLPGQTDFRRELRIIQQSRAGVIVLWGDQPETALILRQMRALGMKQPVFGSYRTLGPEMLAQAGPAAEGFEAVYPYDPTRRDPRWLAFQQQYQALYGAPPEQFSALAYDAMNILLQSICRAGLNRARIQDALDQVGQYQGVTGLMTFDPNNKNISPMYLATVHNGAVTYKLATMDRPQISSAVSRPGSGREGKPQPSPRAPASAADASSADKPSFEGARPQPCRQGPCITPASAADASSVEKPSFEGARLQPCHQGPCITPASAADKPSFEGAQLQPCRQEPCTTPASAADKPSFEGARPQPCHQEPCTTPAPAADKPSFEGARLQPCRQGPCITPASAAGKPSFEGARLQPCRTRRHITPASAAEGSLSPQPYANLGAAAVQYHGPATRAIPPGRALVLLFGPNAARAVEQSRPWPWKIAAVDTGQTGANWGAATTSLVNALSTGRVLAIVALDRDSAHLAEQMSLKKFVPVLALAGDRALTSTNVPWIFRLPAAPGGSASDTLIHGPVADKVGCSELPSGYAEALRILAAAERISGPNPRQLRNVLASGRTLAGHRFTLTGEPEP